MPPVFEMFEFNFSSILWLLRDRKETYRVPYDRAHHHERLGHSDRIGQWLDRKSRTLYIDTVTLDFYRIRITCGRVK